MKKNPSPKAQYVRAKRVEKKRHARRLIGTWFKLQLGKRLPPNEVKAKLEKFMFQVARKYGGEHAALVLNALGAKKLSARVGNMYASIIDAPPDEYLGKTSSIPAVSTEKLISLTGGNDIYRSKVHRIIFTAGDYSTKAVKAAAKLNGINTWNHQDSIRTTLSDVDRASLIYSTGFNQKCQMTMGESFFWSVDDLYDIMDLASLSDRTNAEQVLYANILNLKTNIKITNLNKYLPMIIKIHMVKFSDPANNYRDLIQLTTNSDITTPTQGVNTMPVWNQLTVSANSSMGDYVYVDPKSNGIMSSNEWKAKCEIVRTFTKQIDSGDILDFNYIHRCGPGARVDKIAGAWRASDSSTIQPVTYVPLIEFYGPLVEGYRADNAVYRWLGTGPGAIAFEYKKSLVAANEHTETRVYNDGTSGGMLANRIGMRVYTRDIVRKDATTRIKNVSYSNIVTSAGTSSQLIIPLMVDEVAANASVRT